MDLELEIEKRKTEYEELEAKYKALEVKNLANEKQLDALKHENATLKESIRIGGGRDENKGDFGETRTEERVIDLTTDDDLGEDLVMQLMIENKVLADGKSKAEKDVTAMESKFKALQLWVQEILDPSGERLGLAEKTAVKEATTVGSPSNYTPCKLGDYITEDPKVGRSRGRLARRQLAFEKDASPGKIAPLTPGGVARPSHLGAFDISDWDEEEPVSTTHTQSPTHNDEGSTECKRELSTSPEKKMEKTPLVSTLKRRRALNIVMSDSESDDDEDNIPIGRLKKRNLGTEERKSTVDATRTECCPRGIPTNLSTEGDESSEASSESEGESLGGFIVRDSDVSDDDAEYGEVGFSEVLSKIRRRKERNYKWDFEADMLADFGKDVELCMKAVCALYRQQTCDERSCKGTLYANGRGFSKFDASRGTNLAEFLTGGDSQGDVQKSVEELEKHGPKAVELCRSLASQYSKQLFVIYKNEEDPFFRP